MDALVYKQWACRIFFGKSEGTKPVYLLGVALHVTIILKLILVELVAEQSTG